MAFAADVYGQGIYAKDMKEASELAEKFKGDRKLMRKRAQAAFTALLANKRVN